VLLHFAINILDKIRAFIGNEVDGVLSPREDIAEQLFLSLAEAGMGNNARGFLSVTSMS